MYKIKKRENPSEKIIEKFTDFGLTKLEAILLAQRGIKTKKDAKLFLSGELKDISDGKLLSDMGKAVSEMSFAIGNNKNILIYADYDSDGLCSSVIAEKALKEYIKAKNSLSKFEVYIPNRIEDGFGFKYEPVKDKDFDLLITVDNGISASKELEILKENKPSVKIIITDHHLVTDVLPIGEAVINCHREDDKYPNKNLCGATTIWLVMRELFKAEKLSIDFINSLLPYCAIATITDVMDLSIENRIFIKKGLEIINSANCPIGIKSLMISMGIASVTAETIGFYIGPAINSDGRLYDGVTAREVLMGEKSSEQLKILSDLLVQINKERRELKQKYKELSDYYIEKNNLENSPFIAIAFPSAPEGIIGLVAGDIKEKYGVPAIVLTASGKDSDIFKGSGRSPEDYVLPFPEILDYVREKNLLLGGGGHACACGLSVERKNLKDFAREIKNLCAEKAGDYVSYRFYDIKTEFPTEDLYKAGQILEPSGKNNPPATFFTENLTVTKSSYVGDGSHVVFTFVGPNGEPCRGVAFGKAKKYAEMGEPQTLSCLYTINKDAENTGMIEINIVDFEETSEKPEEVSTEKQILISSCKIR